MNRRTLLKILAASPFCFAASSAKDAFGDTTTPGTTKSFYLWLHGLVGIVLYKDKIQIASAKVDDHVYKFGRAGNTPDSIGQLQDLNRKDYMLKTGTSRTQLPPRDDNFHSFVLNDVDRINPDVTPFILTVPFPDAILPLRIVQINPQPRPGQQLPILPGNLPLVVVFRYDKIDPANLAVMSGNDVFWKVQDQARDLHRHIYVESDPDENTLHDPQPDLDQLLDLFPTKPKFTIPINTCELTALKQRHCHILDDIPSGINGVNRSQKGRLAEELGIWEWKNRCDRDKKNLAAVSNCPASLTYESGYCPPGFALTTGVSWPAGSV